MFTRFVGAIARFEACGRGDPFRIPCSPLTRGLIRIRDLIAFFAHAHSSAEFESPDLRQFRHCSLGARPTEIFGLLAAVLKWMLLRILIVGTMRLRILLGQLA